jgi:VanZ family protein
MAKNPCAAYEVSTRKRFVFRLTTPPTILRMCCALVLGGILVAGLWPFHAPNNEISWLSNANGVLFGDYGSLLSAGAFKPSNSNDGVCLEIWLEPRAVDDAGTILSFYSPGGDSTSFAMRQSLDDVALVRRNLDDKRRAKSSRIYGDHVFRQRKTVFLTISSSGRGTSIYANGVLARISPEFRLSSKDLTGQLVVGNSAVTTDPWPGQLKGFAIYNRELTAAQVMQDYQSRLGDGSQRVSLPDGAIALYLFNEGRGDVVHNRVDSATDLMIPEHFFVLHEPLLELPWNEYYPGWNYWKDVAVNIVGFIPLGLFFCAYFSLVRRVQHPVAVIIAFGFAVSLTIEVLQAFLPTRNSGMTDLITNTFGTALGATLYAWGARRGWFTRSGTPIGSSAGETREVLHLIG